jgi:hypothetical protein
MPHPLTDLRELGQVTQGLARHKAALALRLQTQISPRANELDRVCQVHFMDGNQLIATAQYAIILPLPA